jgi:hypothetical protein
VSRRMAPKALRTRMPVARASESAGTLGLGHRGRTASDHAPAGLRERAKARTVTQRLAILVRSSGTQTCPRSSGAVPCAPAAYRSTWD